MGKMVSKLPECVWKRSVLRLLNGQGMRGASIPGKPLEAAVVSAGPASLQVVGTQAMEALPIPGLSWYVMAEAVNQLYAERAIPSAVTAALFLPAAIKEDQIRAMMQEIRECADFLRLPVSNLTFQLTDGIASPALSVQTLGTRDALELVKKGVSQWPEEDWEVITAGFVGMEGTSMLAVKYEKELLTRYPADFVSRAKEMRRELSAEQAALVVRDEREMVMVSAGDGGIYGALWKLAGLSGKGFAGDHKEIPARQETIEVCEFLDANPYMIKSTGCMVIAAKHGGRILEALKDQGIAAKRIGRITGDHDRILRNGEENRYLEPFRYDEVHRLFGEAKEF